MWDSRRRSCKLARGPSCGSFLDQCRRVHPSSRRGSCSTPAFAPRRRASSITPISSTAIWSTTMPTPPRRPRPATAWVGSAVGAGQQLWAENGAAAPAAWPGPHRHQQAVRQPLRRQSPVRDGGAQLPDRARAGDAGELRGLADRRSGRGDGAAGAGGRPADAAERPALCPTLCPSLGPAGAIAAAVACSIAGLAVVFWGQMASALFDQANATRELVAIERAKQAGDQD